MVCFRSVFGGVFVLISFAQGVKVRNSVNFGVGLGVFPCFCFIFALFVLWVRGACFVLVGRLYTVFLITCIMLSCNSLIFSALTILGAVCVRFGGLYGAKFHLTPFAVFGFPFRMRPRPIGA